MTYYEVYVARRSLGLTQASMAEALGINKRTLQRIETGEYNVSRQVATAVTNLLNAKAIETGTDETRSGSIRKDESAVA